MTAVPQTPVSTRSGLVSPLSTASTLVDLTGTVSKRIHLDGEPSEVNASLVKQKLREALSWVMSPNTSYDRPLIL